MSNYYPFVLHLTAPAIIRDIGQDPSCATSMAYIPGSTIRGALAFRVKKTAPDLFDRIVLSDEVRFLNAYPYVDQKRFLPTPVSYAREKYSHPEVIWDRAALNTQIAGLVPISRPFCSLVEPSVLLYTPAMGRRLHHLRDRKAGLAHGKNENQVGTVYWNEYLESDQDFCGAIYVRDGAETERIVDTLRECTSQPLLLGRAKRSGYGGLATVEWQQPVRREVLLTGRRDVARSIDTGAYFRVVLLSDCVSVNHETGEIDPYSSITELLRQLKGRADLQAIFSGTRLIGGFNRTWRLQTPQEWALAAGSVLVLRATDTIDEQTILDIEDRGLGLRRNEGFGRIVFLAHARNRLSLQTAPTEKPVAPEGSPPKLVLQIEKRIIWNQLVRQCQIRASMIADGVQRLPSPSLLSRLLSALYSKDNALATLSEWLGDNEEKQLKSDAMKQLKVAKFRPPACSSGTRTNLREFIRKIIRAAEGRRERPKHPEDREYFETIIETERISREFGIRDEARTPETRDLVLKFLEAFLGALVYKANIRRRDK